MEAFDILRAASHPDPYPAYRQLLESPDPVWDPTHRLWVVTRAATVRHALAEPALRVRPAAEPVPAALQGRPAGEVFARLVRMNDGAGRHAAPKALLQQALAAVDLDAAARRAADEMAALGTSRDWTMAVPVRTVAALLGFPAPVLDLVVSRVRALVDAFAGRPAADDDASALTADAEALLRGAPAGTVAACLADGEGADRASRIANLIGLLTQTCEATAALLGNAVVALARGADTRNPALVDRVMRFDAPVQNTRRYAVEAVRLGPVRIEAHATVLLVLGAVGHDPAEPANAEPLGFGWGPHRCPGMALARAVVQGALRSRPAAGWPGRWTYEPLPNVRLPRFPPT